MKNQPRSQVLSPTHRDTWVGSWLGLVTCLPESQLRPQGAFPWLWRWPHLKSQGKAPWGRGCLACVASVSVSFGAKKTRGTFRAGHFLRLDRNRKSRLKSLWHPNYQSHVDNRYKQSLLRTMLYRAYRLSFCWLHFSDECNRLRTAFSRLKYPKHLVNSTIKSFVDSKVCDQQRPLSPVKETDDTVRVVLPFKDQISTDIVKEQLKDLNLKVNPTIQPVFASRKIKQELNVKEAKPPIVNDQCVVYNFQCDRCDASYVVYTREHLPIV